MRNSTDPLESHMYSKVDDYSYSIIHGQSLYSYKNEYILCESENKKFPIVYDVLYNDNFLIKRLRSTKNIMSQRDIQTNLHYIRLIKNPPKSNYIIWPVDIIELNSELKLQKKSTLVHHYQIYNDLPDEELSDYALVFLLDSYKNLKSLKIIIEEFKAQRSEKSGLCYKNGRLLHIVWGIISRFSELAEAGYIYYDIDFSRFYLDSEDNVYLDFSNLLYHKNEEYGIRTSQIYLEKPIEFSFDFLEPWLYWINIKRNQEEKYRADYSVFVDHKYADSQSQNYAICAMLFYLFYGRYAYEGKLMSGRNDSGPKEHYSITLERLNTPIFIFDPNDKSNELGLFAADSIFIDRWNASPKELKTIFEKTLTQKNAERKVDEGEVLGEFFSLTPLEWQELFKKFNWVK